MALPNSDVVPASLTAPLTGLPRFLILCFVAALVMVPLLATALGGFKELGELRTNPFGLPKVWQWENYRGILASARYWRILGNSLFISAVTVALTLAVAAPAAFAFAHLRFFGQRFLFNYFILGLTFPFATAILPLFIKVRDLGLLDTHWGIILPQVAFSQALSILLMRNAFRQLPAELLDAALVDGCGYMRFFLWITLPLSRPILATVAVITFVVSWNNFLLPLVVINTNAKYPWTLGLMDYQGEFIVAWQLILAFITLTILPAVMMFVLAQRYIVSGLTAGAVKG
ncbi:carbohydrate ABC transporter permease [Dongia sedimenti]|uniref:Carbohydrate ABC transporter permease n=1 Tax=Dongia sedimenti TaxID=3064282 RepID=A0ABU0YGP7_9PROT|nr:carbohydrate ABC transporter permease [Rhodospirillaceae bacterium R-7]